MWKLFATVLALSDTGSVSSNIITSDFMSRAACETAAREFFSTNIIHQGDGHHVTIKATGRCIPDAALPFRYP